MVMRPFGNRSQLYEQLQSREADNMRLRLYGQYEDATPTERIDALRQESPMTEFPLIFKQPNELTVRPPIQRKARTTAGGETSSTIEL